MTNKDRPVAIVTGSTKGIGRGILDCLVQQGYAVVVTSRNYTQAQSHAKKICENGGRAVGLRFNLEEQNDIDTIIGQTLEHFGHIDLLVNNALSATCVPNFEDLDGLSITNAVTANLTNILLLCKAAKPYLANTKGSIINIGSVVVNKPILGMALYAIIKGGLAQMTKSLASEWAKELIRVNCIQPGFIYSSALEEFKVPPEVIAKTYAHCQQFHPLGNKIGKPEDVGNLVVYLASKQAKFITGSIVNVDAGYSVQGISLQP